MNTEIEILNVVLNRWVENFRSAQVTKVVNEKTINELGIFDLKSDEQTVLIDLNTMFDEWANPQILA